jgi:hypothetical protein
LRQSLILPALTLALLVCAPLDADAVGEGQQCGGLAGVKCDRGLWCDPEPGKCGVKDVQGTCIKIPQVCTKEINYVCGCNKRNYSNDCVRQQKRVAKNHDGQCKK